MSSPTHCPCSFWYSTNRSRCFRRLTRCSSCSQIVRHTATSSKPLSMIQETVIRCFSSCNARLTVCSAFCTSIDSLRKSASFVENSRWYSMPRRDGVMPRTFIVRYPGTSLPSRSRTRINFGISRAYRFRKSDPSATNHSSSVFAPARCAIPRSRRAPVKVSAFICERFVLSPVAIRLTRCPPSFAADRIAELLATRWHTRLPALMIPFTVSSNVIRVLRSPINPSNDVRYSGSIASCVASNSTPHRLPSTRCSYHTHLSPADHL